MGFDQEHQHKNGDQTNHSWDEMGIYWDILGYGWIDNIRKDQIMLD